MTGDLGARVIVSCPGGATERLRTPFHKYNNGYSLCFDQVPGFKFQVFWAQTGSRIWVVSEDQES